ncbi:MAG: hydrogenase formation protein HypD, partial [Deltaproteobacteria bacterium]|nr:hydrogenase formation protein HypD [Deltaproteobacteria bacterium]
TLLSFGDMIRVPGSKESLYHARNQGATVKIIYSPFDAVELALESPGETFVFFSVGFETTAAGVAGIISAKPPGNLKFLIANRYMPPVLRLLMDVHDESIQGFILPGHAATITGVHAYDFMETEFKLPCVITGFEPVDILLGVLELIGMIRENKHQVVNAYPRAVNEMGNPLALERIEEVFEKRAGVWRGIDRIEGSAFYLRKKFDHLNAEIQLDCDPGYPPRPHPPGCQCHRIMLGELLPTDCKLFRDPCSPENPFGPCMVSREGTCNLWYGDKLAFL